MQLTEIACQGWGTVSAGTACDEGQVYADMLLQAQVACLLQELQGLDLELQEVTGEKQADPFLLYLHGLVQIDRQACSWLSETSMEPYIRHRWTPRSGLIWRHLCQMCWTLTSSQCATL